ncbi:MAG: hypothetical protein LBQ41_00710 [Candidatus Ancillula sp.]|jgi:hypothetical protein|nr:hypothetical protein [Candidatus Ancillula sp.]
MLKISKLLNAKLVAGVSALALVAVGAVVVANAASNSPEKTPKADGGEISFIQDSSSPSGWDELHTFYQSGFFETKQPITDARVLVVGGGGAGGGGSTSAVDAQIKSGGGGGAGEVVDVPFGAGAKFLQKTNYVVNVGVGGAGSQSAICRASATMSTLGTGGGASPGKSPYGKGQSSSIQYADDGGSVKILGANGGGGGGTHWGNVCHTTGGDGGSAGGQSWQNTYDPGQAVKYADNPAWANDNSHGNSALTATTSPNYCNSNTGEGGSGAGSSGKILDVGGTCGDGVANINIKQCPLGGNGYTSDIFGHEEEFAGGGGGGNFDCEFGSGRAGGGDGAFIDMTDTARFPVQYKVVGKNAKRNTGSGGGGGAFLPNGTGYANSNTFEAAMAVGGDGGSGIVAIRFHWTPEIENKTSRLTQVADGGSVSFLLSGTGYDEMHIFKSSDELKVHNDNIKTGAAYDINTARVLAVGGGGAGGSAGTYNSTIIGGFGGGAGGMLDLDAEAFDKGVNYPAHIGAGGTSTDASQNGWGSKGQDTTISDILACGGGGGKNSIKGSPTTDIDVYPGQGGSSGGARITNKSSYTGAPPDPRCIPSQGNAGGGVNTNNSTNWHLGPGGGGAGGIGATVNTYGPAQPSNSGDGGKGRYTDITGVLTCLAGGGAGSGSLSVVGATTYRTGIGGSNGGADSLTNRGICTGGGGANGTATANTAYSGIVNTGGGGGGSGGGGLSAVYPGGSGGSGIVVVRFPYLFTIESAAVTRVDDRTLHISARDLLNSANDLDAYEVKCVSEDGSHEISASLTAQASGVDDNIVEPEDIPENIENHCKVRPVSKRTGSNGATTGPTKQKGAWVEATSISSDLPDDPSLIPDSEISGISAAPSKTEASSVDLRIAPVFKNYKQDKELKIEIWRYLDKNCSVDVEAWVKNVQTKCYKSAERVATNVFFPQDGGPYKFTDKRLFPGSVGDPSIRLRQNVEYTYVAVIYNKYNELTIYQPSSSKASAESLAGA